jgi:predicted transposase YdaD
MSSKHHDRGYKRLFSDPLLLRQLLETCVDEPWVHQLDFTTLEPLPTEHVDKRLIANQLDLLFQVRFKGDPALLLLILELQSTPDRFMALRLLHYLCSVYLSLLKRSTARPQKLPPAFPVVLYNGEKPWNAPSDIRQLIDPSDQQLENNPALAPLDAHLPKFQYFCIDEARIDPKTLDEWGNLISALFILETAGEHDIESKVDRLVDHVTVNLNQPGGRRATLHFLEWLNALAGLGRLGKKEIAADPIRARVEVKTMLERTIERLRKKARAEGIEAGRAEGIEAGRAEGIEEGEAAAKARVAKKLLSEGRSPAEVADLVELPEDQVRRLLH